MIGRKAEAVLNRAVRFAVEHEHEYFTLEHVLWALMSEPGIVDTVRACGVDPKQLTSDLEVYLKSDIPKVTSRPSPSGVIGDAEESPVEHPVATLSIQRLIQRALFQVQSAGKEEIRPIDLFVAMFQAKESQALDLMLKQGIERLNVLTLISRGIDQLGDRVAEDGLEMQEDSEPSARNAQAGASRTATAESIGVDDILSLYVVSLNERAMQGRIDPLVGRQAELDRVIQVLCRRRKNNPLLVGEAGVGKTALAEGLAMRIVQEQIPSLLSNAIIYSLDLGAVLAGAKFRGDFEQRFKKILAALQKKREAGFHPVLLIDEIHAIIGAGAVSGGALDAANLLKPLLTQGEIRCIGSTTYSEYRNIFEKDHALARRFQKVDIVEPSVEETVQILSGLKVRFEEHHGVQYTPEAVRAAVELSSKHLTDRFQPDKAIDVIDEAGAKARLKSGMKNRLKTLDVSAIEEVIAQIARIPAKSVSISQKSRLKNLDRDLKLGLFGQDHAVDALVTSIRLARSGLRSGDRPIGAFLFCGPTGVGKTELSKQLAQCLGVSLLRFDMSEYGEKHTVSRLIGAPPGYVGFEQAGLLTDAVLKNPHAIVLLDEIEKAHSDIWNILLQVMDHGFLTDNNGRKADFRNTILIMTSNVGSRELERRPLGMSAHEIKGSNASRAVERTFSPEFRNRLDSIVFFNPLEPATVGLVVNKHFLELEGQLLARGVELDLGNEVREWLARKGYDRLMGARPLARLIQDLVKKPLAEEILFGKLESGGEVKISVRNDEVVFEFRPKTVGVGKTSANRERQSAHVSTGVHRG